MDSNTDLLFKYKELLDSGIITQEEFDAKKNEILAIKEVATNNVSSQPVSGANGANAANGAANTNQVDDGSIGWAVLGAFIPLVGLILFIVWNNTKPNSAKKAGIGALIGVGIAILFYVTVGCTALAYL